jgi:hypothetical protein
MFDPVTFASADRLWVDLHWLFQVVLALVYRVGSIPGIILLPAALSGLTLLVIRTARGRSWPAWISVVVWLPAVNLMACRAAPRPEIVSVWNFSSSTDRWRPWLWLAKPSGTGGRCHGKPPTESPPHYFTWVTRLPPTEFGTAPRLRPLSP